MLEDQRDAIEPTAPRALVTGGAGFIGSHLVRWLVERGTETLVVDDLSRGQADRLPDSARLEVGDLVTSDLQRIFRVWQPGVVFHLAGQTSVPRSMADPERDLTVNVVGTRRTLDAARSAGASSFVFVSSGGAIYGETTSAASELSAPRPTSYYGMHKLLAEHYVRNSGLPAMIARPSNVYGPYQSPGADGAVVPSFVADAIHRRPLSIHGSGTQVRDFVYVTDMVEALLLIARAGQGGVWNVASGHGTTILDLADAVVAAVGTDHGRVYQPSRTGDIHRSVLARARLTRLGWEPRVALSEGLRRTVRAALEGDRSVGN